MAKRVRYGHERAITSDHISLVGLRVTWADRQPPYEVGTIVRMCEEVVGHQFVEVAWECEPGSDDDGAIRTLHHLDNLVLADSE